MNDYKQILSTICRPFQQEIRKGCQDDVVINGMGDYVKLWVGNARKLNLTSILNLLNGKVLLKKPLN